MNQLPLITRYWWGGMGAFFIVLYVQGSLRRGQILYYTDAQNMIGLLQDHGIFAKWLAGMSFTLHLSIIVSCLLLLAGRKSGVYLGLLQIPFRLMFMVPSISILLVWAKLSPAYSLQPTAYSLQPTAYSLQPTAYSLQPTASGSCLFWSLLPRS